MNTFVISIWDFLHHVTLHRKRVLKLGWQLRWMTDSPLILFLVLWIHDLEKYLFLPWLWSYYGGKRYRTGAQNLYDRMNKFGRLLQNLVLLPFFWKQKTIAEVLRIEHIADIVDRSADPVVMEEFNLREHRSLTRFLPKEDWLIAMKLKRRWAQITFSLQYRQ